jgi:hypothetical protein
VADTSSGEGLRRLIEFQRSLERKEPETEAQPEEPEWLAGIFRGATPCVAPEQAGRARESLDSSRTRTWGGIEFYLDDPTPSGILLVKAAAGMGKTTLGIRAAERQAEKGWRVLVPGPRHLFFEDILAITKQPELWYHWWPRQGQDAPNGGPETCVHKDAIDRWMARGYKAIDFCSQVCGWETIEEKCVYHLQKRRQEPIIFGQHQHVVTGHPMEFHLVIGDECPLTQFQHKWTIPPNWIAWKDMDPESELTHMLYEMAGIAVSGELLFGRALLDKLGGPRRVLDACADFHPRGYPEIHQASQVDAQDYAHLDPLTKLLAHEAEIALRGEDYVYRVLLGKRGLTLFLRRTLDDRLPAHMIWMDATGREGIYQDVMKRPVKMLDAQPEIRGRIYQVIGRSYHKGSVAEEGDFASKSASRMIAQAVRVVNKIKEDRGYKNAGIITFKDLADRADLFPDMLRGHFWGSRGTNYFEGCDGLFVLGAPSTRPVDLEDAARCLFNKRDAPFRTAWTTIERSFNYVDEEGRGWQHQVAGYWHDPDLQVLQEMNREDEIEQAVHRARPLHRDVDVWLITTIPIANIPLTGLLTYSDVFGMAKDAGVNVWMWEEIVKVAEEAEAVRGAVTTLDMIEKLGVTRATACRYVRAIAKMPGWQEARVLGAERKGKGGNPRVGAQRCK